MNQCTCGSWAINPNKNGRDDSNLDLCDVCFWRDKFTESKAREDKMAAALQSVNERLENGDDIMVQTTPWRMTMDLVDEALDAWRAAK